MQLLLHINNSTLATFTIFYALNTWDKPRTFIRSFLHLQPCK